MENLLAGSVAELVERRRVDLRPTLEFAGQSDLNVERDTEWVLSSLGVRDDRESDSSRPRRELRKDTLTRDTAVGPWPRMIKTHTDESEEREREREREKGRFWCEPTLLWFNRLLCFSSRTPCKGFVFQETPPRRDWLRVACACPRLVYLRYVSSDRFGRWIVPTL